MRSRTMLLTGLLLTFVLSAPAALAWKPDLPVETQVVQVADRDGDGHREAWGGVNTGRLCGCACPEVGGTLVVTAAGQRASVLVWTVLVVCGTAALFDADPGAVDPAGPVGATFTPYVWPPLEAAELLA